MIQTRYYKSQRVLAVVVSTSFWTAKGTLVRSILFPKPLNVKLWKDAVKFVLALAVIAFAGVAYSLAINLYHGVSGHRVAHQKTDSCVDIYCDRPPVTLPSPPLPSSLSCPLPLPSPLLSFATLPSPPLPFHLPSPALSPFPSPLLSSASLQYNVGETMFRSLDVVTILVAPALPAALTVGTVYAIARLKKKKIHCISPQRLVGIGQSHDGHMTVT